MENPVTLEVFSDIACPWCYFSIGRIEQLKQEFNLEVKWIAYPLHPETPEEGSNLEELLAERNLDISEVQASLKKVADGVGLPFSPCSMIYNSRRAQELTKWAESLGKGDECHDAMFRAYFVDCLNIAKIPVLKDIADSIGLPGNDVEKVLSEGLFKDAVDRDWEYSEACEILAAPTFIVNGKRAVGAQPYETLRQLVMNNSHALSMA